MHGTSNATHWGNGAQTAHLVAGMAAAVLSLLFHFVLIRTMPPVRMGSAASAEPERPPRAMVLEEVQAQEAHRLEVPDVLRPEASAQALAGAAQPEVFVSALDPVLLEPSEPSAALEAPAEAAAPAALPERPSWEPRQERIEISKRIVPDEVAALPRKVEPRVDSTPQAPDIVLPASFPAPIMPTRGNAALPAWPVQGLAPDEEYGLIRDPKVAGRPASDGPPVQGALPEARADSASRLMDEKPGEVTPLKPIEEMLALDLQTYRPPTPDGFLYFKMGIRRASPEVLPVLSKDMLIIQDSSESMTQAKLHECKKGVMAMLKELRPGDRFNVMAFDEKQTRCFDEWTAATPDLIAKANWFIEGLEARGRTDVHASLQQMLTMPREPGRLQLAVYVTDGRPTMGLVDNSQIMERFSRANQGELAVFTFGGGAKVNRFLLDFLSYKNRGDVKTVPNSSEIPEALRGFGQELSRPILTELSYRASGLAEKDLFPRNLTPLFLDRSLFVCGRVPDSAPTAGLQVVGKSGARTCDMVFPIAWDQAQPGTEALRLEWALQKAYFLIGEHIRTQDPSTMSELSELAKQYGISVPYGLEMSVPR